MGMTFVDEAPNSVMDFIIGESTRADNGYLVAPVMISNLDNETYFVALEKSDLGGNRISVHLEVYDIEHHPYAQDGMVFGYRRFHEAEGPHRYGCPPMLINELTDSDLLLSRKWRNDNYEFNKTDEGMGCVRDAIVTDLRLAPSQPKLRF